MITIHGEDRLREDLMPPQCEDQIIVSFVIQLNVTASQLTAEKHLVGQTIVSGTLCAVRKKSRHNTEACLLLVECRCPPSTRQFWVSTRWGR